MEVGLERLLRYDQWANREVLAWLRAGERPERCGRLMAHILAVHALFAARIEGAPTPAVWPDPLGFDFDAALSAVAAAWDRILTTRAREGADVPITYVNSKGERWTSRLSDIVTHVVLHGSYHRGQIAILAGSAGIEPPYTDYIHGTRAGLV